MPYLSYGPGRGSFVVRKAKAFMVYSCSSLYRHRTMAYIFSRTRLLLMACCGNPLVLFFFTCPPSLQMDESGRKSQLILGCEIKPRGEGIFCKIYMNIWVSERILTINGYLVTAIYKQPSRPTSPLYQLDTLAGLNSRCRCDRTAEAVQHWAISLSGCCVALL